MLSGLLTSYAIIGRLKNKQSPGILKEYFSRVLRIVPTLAALIIFCTFIFPELGQGPQWNLVVNKHAEICQKNWWRNFLFIHNYYGFEDMVMEIFNSLIKWVLFFIYIKSTLRAVSYAYTPPWHRYTIVHIVADPDCYAVEMAEAGIDCIVIPCYIQHWREILRYQLM